MAGHDVGGAEVDAVSLHPEPGARFNEFKTVELAKFNCGPLSD